MSDENVVPFPPRDEPNGEIAEPVAEAQEAAKPPQPPTADSLDVEPQPAPVNLARIMDDLIEGHLRRYLALDTHVAELFVLYGVGTHCLDIASHAPRLFLRSATPRCGKSTAIKVMAQFVRNAEIVSEVSRSSLFHTIHETGATVMVDEADESIAGHRPLFAILHSGQDRAGAYIKQMYRGENKRFSTFAFIIFGCIGNLHPQLMDRCIIADMQRDNEGRRKFRPERAEELREMGRKFSEWAADNSELLAAYDPVMPDLHNDRAEDNWRLMVAIADLAGGTWPHRARAAAVHLSRGAEPEVSEPEALLHDIREVWDGNPPKIRSTDLATCLRDMEGRPWSTLNPDRMAKLLKNFPDGRGGMIKPKQLRFGPAGGIHGYKASQFANAFARYPKPVADVAGVAVETTWPSLDEIAAAVEAVRAEIASKKPPPPDEEIAAPVSPSPMLPTPSSPASVEAEPGVGATGATGATPAEPVAPEPVVEPKPSGVTPEMHTRIMESMAEKDPEIYAELMKEAQAKAATSPLRADAGGASAAAPAPEPAEAANPTEAKVETEAGEPIPVQPTKKNPRGRPPGRPLHPKIGDFWLYGRDADGMMVPSNNAAAVRWFTRCFHQTEEKPEGDWWPEGPGHSTLAAAKNSIG